MSHVIFGAFKWQIFTIVKLIMFIVWLKPIFFFFYLIILQMNFKDHSSL